MDDKTRTPANTPEAADEHLRYIRDVMQRSSEFTGVSGWGLVLAGGLAIAAATAGEVGQIHGPTWVGFWLAVAAVSAAVGSGLTVRKAQRLGLPVVSGTGRKILLCLAPAFVAGAVLTGVLTGRQLWDLLPGTWLMIYGAGVAAAGTYSVRAVAGAGGTMLAIGAIAVLSPAELANLWMAAGFGLVHVVLGLWVLRNHGG